MKNLKGFVDYEIDAVVKFGGSLLGDPINVQKAIDSLVKCLSLDLRILVIPGGGPTDNTIEMLDKRHPFHPNTHHYACAKAQDQTGLMICDPVFGNSLKSCHTLQDVREALNNNQVPVLLPSEIIFAIDPFERTWEITSDAMAAWFAWLVNASTLVVLTNVDGIYPLDNTKYEGTPIKQIRASQLIEWGHTAVDACTPPFLLDSGINTWVINGNDSERLKSALSGEETIGTLILAK